jgi:hypothetical protein
MQTTYKDMEHKLYRRIPFTGNSARAVIVVDRMGLTEYQVWSYQTLIATWPDVGMKTIDVDKYSKTTGRLQHLIKRAWGI